VEGESRKRRGGDVENGTFEIEIIDGVARCTMRGPRMNALGVELMAPLFDGLEDVIAREEVRVVVLRGSEGNFTVGADLTTMGEKMDPALMQVNMARMGSILLALHEGPRPFITEVDGWAVGGGLGMALAADITFATERAQFFLSFPRVAIMPDFGTPYFLVERVGAAKARELALTAARIDAEEALRIGLINRLVPSEKISEEVMRVASKLASRSPEVMAETKRSVNRAHRMGLEAELDYEASRQPFFVLAPEHRLAVEKFFEERKK